MRLFLISAATAMAMLSAPAMAQDAPAAAAATVKAKYTTSDTDLGTLLDDPAAKAIIEKYIPGLTNNDQIDMARGMTLKAIQQYAPDDVTDERLAAIDTDLAKLPQ